MNLKKLTINLIIITFALSSIAEEKLTDNQDTEFSVYNGTFEFSDNEKQ